MRTHGKSQTAEYKIWKAMRKRCRNRHNADYPYSGGRGIGVDPRWEDFQQFLADMGKRPSPEFTIDRIDGDRDYGPDNCRWATRKDQARNFSNNHLVTAFGRTMPMSEWAEATGIPYSTLRSRLRKGWDHERAVSEPPRQKLPNGTYNIDVAVNGQTHTLREWSRIVGVRYTVLTLRIFHLGWSPERAVTTSPGASQAS